MPANEHSILSPSGSFMWLNCPAAAKKNVTSKEETEAMKYGTESHALVEFKLKKALNLTFSDEILNLDTFIEALPLYDEDMGKDTDGFVNHVMHCIRHDEIEADEKATILIEEKVNLTKITKN